MFLSRDSDFTNDPKILYEQYFAKKRSLNIPEPWMLKDEAEAKMLITKFFDPEYFLKRVILTLQKKKKIDMSRKISLTTYYLQFDKRVKLLNMIDIKKSKAL